MGSRPALAVRDLSYAYDRGPPALEHVSFSVERGTFTALLGPNGAGKTTLMALVTRLFQSRTGQIEIGGRDLARSPRDALAAMGVVFQRPTLDLDLTVAQNLRYAAQLFGLPGATARDRIAAGLAQLDLEAERDRTVRTLSGGMRRRVELARALLHAPELLILDEPTVGLDIASRRTITGHVHELCREHRLAALWTTHLIDEIEPDDAVVMLANGRVVASGDSRSIAAASGVASLAEAYARLCIAGRDAAA